MSTERHVLPADRLAPSARERVESFHRNVVEEVIAAIASERVVVVGMGINPHVKRARRALTAAGIAHRYLEYGNYFGGWQERLAIKMWSGWPRFPQVFVDGTLIGGANETERAIADKKI